MKSSKRTVNCAMRSRSSLKPKSMLGRVSAMEGTLAPYCACETEREEEKREGVMTVAILADRVLRWVELA